jgi:hypothetical protein
VLEEYSQGGRRPAIDFATGIAERTDRADLVSVSSEIGTAGGRAGLRHLPKIVAGIQYAVPLVLCFSDPCQDHSVESNAKHAHTSKGGGYGTARR